MIKMIAFDMDGTIADTVPMCIKAFTSSIFPYIHRNPTQEELVSVFGLDESGVMKAIVGDQWQAALDDFYKEYEELHYMCREVFDGVRELIAHIRSKGIKLALVTGKGKVTCDITLRKLDLCNVFDEIMCGSPECINKAESIRTLLKRHNLTREDFFYIGDAVTDIEQCRKAGVTCLSAEWQGDIYLSGVKALNPDNIFYTVSEIKEFIDSLT